MAVQLNNVIERYNKEILIAISTHIGFNFHI